MDLQDLFSRSFAIWWRVRSLWVVGILAALVGQGEYGASANFQWNNPTVSPIRPDGPPPLDQLRAEPQLAWLLDNLIAIAAIIIVVALIWALIAGLVGALANGAMITLADSAGRDMPADLGSGMRAGAARMLPLFLIGFILALPTLLFLAAIFALVGGTLMQIFSGRMEDPAAIIPALFGALGCLILLAIPAFVIGVVITLLGRLAARACVIEGLGPLASIGRGWGLFRRNLGPTLLLWLVMGLIGLVLSALMAAPAVALLIPIGIGLAGGGLSGLPILAAVGLAIYGLLVNVGIGGVLTSFNATIWTLHYSGLAAREAGSSAAY